MTFTVTPTGIDAPYKYVFDGTLLYNGEITYANEPPFGTLDAFQVIYGTGFDEETFGASMLYHTIDGAGQIASAEAIGTLHAYLQIYGTGISSLEAFGADHVYFWVHPTGLISKETFGAADAFSILGAVGIASLEAFGTGIEVTFAVLPTGIPSSSAFGSFTTFYEAVDTSIPSLEAFGNAEVAFPIYPVGFDSSAGGFPNIGFPTAGFHTTNLSSLIYLFDPVLYNTLYAMEAHCYAQTSGYTTYSSGWIALSNAIVGYIQVDRKNLMKNFINALFSYIVLNFMYHTDNSLLSSSIATNIWGMNGYSNAIKADAVAHYTDGTGSLLSSDASTISAITTQDDNVALGLITGYTSVVTAQVMSQMFNPNPPHPDPWSKSVVTNLIFITLGFKGVYSSFNIDLALPPGL